MSKRNRREHGRIISVETKTRGDALADDVAAGVASITVEDAGDFDEDGGWLLIGGQVVEFTECDDDTGAIALADPLTAAAEQGDPVQVWSELYEEVVDYQQALVELDGEYDNPDPVVAEVAEGVGELPEGDRGKAGESCTLHRVGEDEWEVVGVGGRPRASQSIRFEQDDAYALTTADITAGSATMPLSHRPIDEALTCVLAGSPQRPTSWTIDYNAQTLTVPLSGWEKAGDPLWAHYAYRKGIATAVVSSVGTQRFYLPSTLTAADVTVPFSSEWEHVNVGGNTTPAPASQKMTLARGTTQVVSGGTVDAWTNASTTLDVLGTQFVSHEQVSAPVTIEGTISAQVECYVSSTASLNGFLQLIARVVSADGSTVRGTLYAGAQQTTATTTPGAQNERINMSNPDMRYWTDVPLSPVDAQAGDRIVVEVGYRHIADSNALGSSVQFNFGEQPTPNPDSGNEAYIELTTNAGLA